MFSSALVQGVWGGLFVLWPAKELRPTCRNAQTIATIHTPARSPAGWVEVWPVYHEATCVASRFTEGYSSAQVACTHVIRSSCFAAWSSASNSSRAPPPHRTRYFFFLGRGQLWSVYTYVCVPLAEGWLCNVRVPQMRRGGRCR